MSNILQQKPIITGADLLISPLSNFYKKNKKISLWKKYHLVYKAPLEFLAHLLWTQASKGYGRRRQRAMDAGVKGLWTQASKD